LFFWSVYFCFSLNLVLFLLMYCCFMFSVCFGLCCGCWDLCFCSDLFARSILFLTSNLVCFYFEALLLMEVFSGQVFIKELEVIKISIQIHIPCTMFEFE
jgi:hypothetical protein